MTLTAAIALMATLGASAQQPLEGTFSGPATWAEELRRVTEAHRALRAYDLDIDAAIETGASSMPVRVNVKCDERQRCLRRFLSSTTLETPELSLMINGVTRTITVSRREPTAISPLEGTDLTKNLEATLFKQGVSVSGGDATPLGRRWVVATDQPRFRSVELYVDFDTHLVKRLRYQTSTSEGAETRVDVTYTWRDPSRVDPSAFEIEQFVREQSGTYTPADAYANYSIVTSIPK